MRLRERSERLFRRQVLVDVAVVCALTALGAFLRIGEIGQSTLWLDDAWIALSYRADSVHEVILAGLTAPGFAALFKGWSAVVGFSTTRAQVLPFLLGVAAPPVVYAVLVRRGVGVVAAATGAFLLAGSRLHISYSTRVKQYTLDALVTVGFLAAAWWVLEKRDDPRRWWVLAGVSIGAAVLSSVAIVFVVSGLVVAALALARAHGPRALRVALAPGAVVAAFLAGWWAIVLRPANNPRLRDFWARRFIDLDEGPTAAYKDTIHALKRVITEALVPGRIALVIVLVAAVVALWRRPAVAFLLLVPLGTAVVLAALELVPLGTGRTDIYLYPALAMLVAVALAEIGDLFLPAAVAAALALGALWLVERERPLHYKQQDMAPFVREIEAASSPSEAIFIYPFSQFAYGLYTRYHVDLVETSKYSTGFVVRIDRPNVFIPEEHWLRVEQYGPMIDRIAATQDTVWFVATHARDQVPKIEELLRARGYRRDLFRRRPGAVLTRWSRGPSG